MRAGELRWPTWAVATWGAFCALTGMLVERSLKTPTHAIWCPEPACPPPPSASQAFDLSGGRDWRGR